MGALEQVIKLPLSGRRSGAGTAAVAAVGAAVLLPPGALELLILQPSPFCNLDCDYCYLPDRQSRSRMPLDLLDRIVAQVMASGLAGAQLSLVWHAGEPMAVPRHWYEAAFEIIERHAGDCAVTHHFQTNAVLINAAWCDFFSRHRVLVGVSIDGPAQLHDRHRRARDGRGTHARVMSGICQLREAGIPFHTICVLTREAFELPDALYDFFAALGTLEVGFNIEEIEAEHTQSSLQGDGAPAAARRFWQRIVERQAREPGRVRIRELAMVLGGLRDPAFGQRRGNSQNQAGRILSVAHDGEFCFWSPELLGAQDAQRGRISLGNLTADPFDLARLSQSPELRRWQAEIDQGVLACEAGCAYYRLCLGGAPANKLAELGTMTGTETMACRLGLQTLVDAALEALDRQLAPLA
jgi:uncharacterized protein